MTSSLAKQPPSVFNRHFMKTSALFSSFIKSEWPLILIPILLITCKNAVEPISKNAGIMDAGPSFVLNS